MTEEFQNVMHAYLLVYFMTLQDTEMSLLMLRITMLECMQLLSESISVPLGSIERYRVFPK